MRLDLNCVRDTLLAIEDLEEPRADGSSDGLVLHKILSHKRLIKYEQNQILYTIRMLHDGGYISYTPIQTSKNNRSAEDILFRGKDGLTFQGHQYLANIRDDTIWKKIMTIISKSGSSTTLDIIASVATNIISEMLQSKKNNT